VSPAATVIQAAAAAWSSGCGSGRHRRCGHAPYLRTTSALSTCAGAKQGDHHETICAAASPPRSGRRWRQSPTTPRACSSRQCKSSPATGGNRVRLAQGRSELNSYPNFITEIDGLDIHFIHVRSRHENALPVIVTHGWPGSVVEQRQSQLMADPPISRGFKSRKIQSDVPARLPPGQYAATDFPILSSGPTPNISVENLRPISSPLPPWRTGRRPEFSQGARAALVRSWCTRQRFFFGGTNVCRWHRSKMTSSIERTVLCADGA
jgi:hypothetical protein